MNKWLGFSIAVVAVIGAFVLGQRVRPLSGDVNPVGFHVKGQVQINGNNKLNLSKCTSTASNPCDLTFDFLLDQNATPAAQNCNSGTNCVSFGNPNGKTLDVTIVFPDSSPNPTSTPYLVQGRLQKGP